MDMGYVGGHPHACLPFHSRPLQQCGLREKVALGDLTPPQQQQLTAFLQQLQALKPPRSVGCSACHISVFAWLHV